MSGLEKMMISSGVVGVGFLFLIIFITGFVTVIFGGTGAMENEGKVDYEIFGQGVVSAQVEAFREQIKGNCERNDIPEYEALAIAIIMIESGGTGGDIMGATKHQDPRVTDPIIREDVSIMQGMGVLANKIRLVGVSAPNDLPRIKLVLQAYNFGQAYFNAFIEWSKGQPAYIENGYSQQLAEVYISSIVATEQVEPFGDVTYPSKVMQYYNYRAIGDNLSLPVDKELGKVVTWFGDKVKNNTGEWIDSKGIIYEAENGVPIYAVDEGVVEAIGYGSTSNGLNGFGRYYIINHGNRIFSLYANCLEEQALIKVGDNVRKGQHIAHVGNSGATTKSILHFELRLGGADAEAINPKPFLYPEETKQGG